MDFKFILFEQSDGFDFHAALRRCDEEVLRAMYEGARTELVDKFGKDWRPLSEWRRPKKIKPLVDSGRFK